MEALEIIALILGLIYLILFKVSKKKKIRVRQTLKFNNSQTIKNFVGENIMTQFQLDQHAIWSLNFLNDNQMPVEVASFSAVSNVEGIVVEVLPYNPETFTYSVKISATAVTAGAVEAMGVTASGVQIPIQLAVTTIPDEAESVTSSVVINEND